MSSSYLSNSQTYSVDVVFPSVIELYNALQSFSLACDSKDTCSMVFDNAGMRIEWTNTSKSMQSILDIHEKVDLQCYLNDLYTNHVSMKSLRENRYH